MLHRLRKLSRRLLHRAVLVDGPIRLDRRHVYILPTRTGLMFVVILLAMLIGAINYNNSLAYVLVFLLSSLAVVSTLHTFRNLHGLIFHAGHPAAVFAGTSARFPVAIESRQGDRFAITLHIENHTPVIADINDHQMCWVELHIPSLRRGWLPLPRITVSTRYPLGLFRAWGYLHFNAHALIYPVPAQEPGLPVMAIEASDTGSNRVRGSDDFLQLRPYHPGDSLRHVYWKAYARDLGLVVKEFGAAQTRDLWLSWEATTERDSESRLSQLCRWIIDYESEGISYGLLMPGHRIEPGHGEAHRRQCLEILALHEIEAPPHG